MKKFGVQSQSFETYKKFKDICEQQGWVYNDQFSTFREEKVLEHNQCIYFSPIWNEDSQGGPRFSFTCSKDAKINLDTDFAIGVDTAFKYLYELDPEKVKLATRTQWFSLLPDGYRERAEANADIDKRSVLVESVYSALAGGFVWEKSPEKSTFWSKVSHNYLTPALLPPLPDKIKEAPAQSQRLISEWYQDLPRGYRARAIRNMSNDVLVGTMQEAIILGMQWRDTPEKESFWHLVHNFYLGRNSLPAVPDNTVY